MNDFLPGLSIIIPTYRRAEQTRRALELLYASRGWDTEFWPEVILSDSTEDASIKDLASHFYHPTPMHIRPDFTGIAANKNAGARQSRHEILVFCDSDIEVAPDALLNMANYLKEHPGVAIVGGQVIWRGGEKDGQLDRPRKEDSMETVEGTSYIEAIYSRFMGTYKNLFLHVGGYDSDIFNMRGEGSDLSIRYWRSGFPLAYADSVFVHHVYEAPGAVTRSIDVWERGIIRDLIQLGYRYGLSRENSPNFARTLRWLTEQFGDSDKYVIIENVVSLLPYFWENREKIEKSKQTIPHEYDFTFLDVFTKKELFLHCLRNAKEKIAMSYKKAFPER